MFRKQKYIQEEREKAMYEEDMFTRYAGVKSCNTSKLNAHNSMFVEQK